jgi:hypothetical protein
MRIAETLKAREARMADEAKDKADDARLKARTRARDRRVTAGEPTRGLYDSDGRRR